jgi:hypothetical protein
VNSESVVSADDGSWAAVRTGGMGRGWAGETASDAEVVVVGSTGAMGYVFAIFMPGPLRSGTVVSWLRRRRGRAV